MRWGLLAMVSLTGLVWGQPVPTRYALDRAAPASLSLQAADSTLNTGLASNSVVDIRAAADSLLFFGTSRGLSLTRDLGETFLSYVADMTQLPEGGISALDIVDTSIAVAALVDTVISGRLWDKGRGLAYSADLGNEWIYIPQPQDGEDDTTLVWGDTTISRLAVTTLVANATYDVAISQGVIWAASWASGLRKYDLAAGQWKHVPLPLDDDTTFSCDSDLDGYELNARDPNDGGSDNHKVFSVIAHDSVLWVGTAAGINRGIVAESGDCIAWTHYTARRNGLSGNWVVALHRQVTSGIERIWASTVNASDLSEVRGVSYTEDGGLTWRVTLLRQRAHNITSIGDTVYVATNSGLYKSTDSRNWALFQSAVNKLTDEEVWAEQTFGALYDSRDNTLWISTPDGLASTQNAGVDWLIERSFVSTADSGEVAFYAYPNPFILSEDNFRDGRGHVRFQYHVTAAQEGAADIAIYDFALDPVATLPKRVHTSPGDYSQVWDGRNAAGRQVANGVYYCRITLGSDEHWTKVMVIK